MARQTHEDDRSPEHDNLVTAAAAEWRATWGLAKMPETTGFVAALPIGRTSGGVAWLLVDRFRLLSWLVAPNACRAAVSALAHTSVPVAEPFGRCTDGQPRLRTFSLFKRNGVYTFDWFAHRALARTGRAGCRAASEMELALPLAEMERLREILDPDALAAMSGTVPGKQVRSAAAYNALAGAGAADPVTAGRWRRQAATAFPLFAGMMRHHVALTAVIDAAAPLTPALATEFGVRGATMTALSGQPFGTSIRPSRLLPLVQVADLVPPDWMPKDAASWHALRGFSNLCDTLGIVPPPPGGNTAARTGFRAAVSQFARRNGPDWSAAKAGRTDVAHIADAARAMVIEAVLPVLAVEGMLPQGWLGCLLPQIGALWLATTRSPTALLKLSREHLTRLVAEGREPRRTAYSTTPTWSNLVWEPLGADAESPEGVMVRNLFSQAALDEEGREMGHCVASYGWRCATGPGRILSLTAKDEETGALVRLSTAEVTVGVDGKLSCHQHKGQRNGRVPPAAVAALAWYLSALRNGDVPSRVEAIMATARNRQVLDALEHGRMLPNGDPGEALAAACGFDWRSADARAAAWERWSHLLGGTARRNGVAAFLRAVPDAVLDTDPDCPLRAALRRFRDPQAEALAA